MVSKAELCKSDPLQICSTEAGVILQLLPSDPSGPTHISQPHQHRHPGDDGAEDIVIFNGQGPPKGDFNIFNWLLMVL
jgi:hypothetical protein